MDIAAWLRGLDLGQYEAAFRDNDIDAAVLPELTTEDLISIGVTSVGHRRKLLSAIAALGASAATTTPTAASNRPDRRTSPSAGAARPPREAIHPRLPPSL